MLYLLICICCITCAIIIILFVFTMKSKTQIENLNNKLFYIDSKRLFLNREVNRLKKQIEILEKKDFEELQQNSLKYSNEPQKYNGLFEGKKAIVGNYNSFFAKQTREMLMLFGLTVDIVDTGVALYDKIINGCKYDIIFTNNIYLSGYNGPELLHKLKSLDNFNIPIVVHTISQGRREYFINDIGFDEYIEKPVKYNEVEKVLNKLL